MERLEACCHLDEGLPDFPLTELSCVLLVLDDLCVQITAVCKLHHDAQRRGRLIEERLLVGYHIFVAASTKKRN